MPDVVTIADNTQVASGAGDTIRDKDRSGVKTQIVGIDVNIGGTEQLMDTTHGLPVQAVRSATSALTNVTASTTSASVLASNTSRTSYKITNDCTTVVYVALTASAATTSAYSFQIQPGQTYESADGYTGAITAILGAGATSGSLRVTELTA